MDREDSIIIERLKQSSRNKDKKIERLRKEKEWLLNEHSFMKYGSSYNGLPTNYRDNMIKDMQKALKEK